MRDKKGRFIKGNVSWHKGTKGLFKHSEESKNKISINNAKNMLNKHHTLESRLKIKEARKRQVMLKGKDSPFWKGGISSERTKIYNSKEYKLWRYSVFKRDNFTCIWCGAISGKGKHIDFQADHIKPFAYYPELRFAIDNGRTLCKPCHRTTDTFGGRARKLKKLESGEPPVSYEKLK